MKLEAILDGRNLSKVFVDGKLYVEVLRDVNLQINCGEMVAIVGTSGEGKSTLLHILGGLEPPSSGEVQICGKNLTEANPAEQGLLRNHYLGFIYQFHHLLPEFNIVENVAMPLLVRGMAHKMAKTQAIELLNKVGLSQRLKHRIGEISGGERQRVAIARALITEPACVLADEPTGNLDHYTAENIYELLLKLNEEFKTSFLLVTHDHNLADKLHRKLILSGGQLIPGK